MINKKTPKKTFHRLGITALSDALLNLTCHRSGAIIFQIQPAHWYNADKLLATSFEGSKQKLAEINLIQ